MGRRIRRLALAAAGLCALAGCHQSAVQQKPPPDPLLISKKPIEGRPHADDRDGGMTVRAPAPPAPLTSGEFAQEPPGAVKAVSSVPPGR